MSEFLNTFGKGGEFHEIAKLTQPTATHEDISKGLNHDHPDFRKAAASNPNATKEHLDKALGDSSRYGHYVRAAAAKNPNATKEHLDRALGDSSLMVRAAAAKNPNATKEHLDKALDDKSTSVRAAAASNPNTTKEHLDKALSDFSENGNYVREAAKKNLESRK